MVQKANLKLDDIDLRLFKQRTYKEVIWYRDQGKYVVQSKAARVAKSDTEQLCTHVL
jgi:hypothetical protein